jgi:cobalt-zinc-cadmium efflux system outer membrane protein
LFRYFPWPYLLACLAGLSLPLPALAASLVLDREGAIGYTLLHNPGVRAAAQLLTSARTHKISANALPNPSLGLAVSGYNPSNQSGESITVQMTQTLQLEAPRRAKSALALEDERAAALDYALVRQAAVNTTQKAFNQVLATRYLLGVANDNLAWNGQLKQAADAKLKLGEVPVVEAFRASVALAQARQDLAAAANERMLALARLRLAVGHMAPLDIAQGSPYEIALVSLPAASELVARGLKQRLELASLSSSLRHEQLTEQWLHASLLSSLDLVAGAGPVSGVPGLTAGVNVPMPLWYRQEGELAQSSATQAGLLYQHQALENSVQAEIEALYAQIQLLESQIRLYQAQLLPSAHELVKQTRERYLTGDASGYELLDTRRSYKLALVAYGQSYLAYRNALADLETSLGTDLAFVKE